MKTRQSPLKNKPRRVAGQSVQVELDKLWEKIHNRVFLAVIAVVLLLLEIWRWFTKLPPNPIGTAIVCIPAFCYAAYQIYAFRSRIKNLEQGLIGEKVVGDKLENLRALDYFVFHDLIGGQFNLDHVLVGPAGIFTVETKTWSKSKGDKIGCDGEILRKNGVEVKPNPVDQAKAQARWLCGLIKELTDLNVFVQPVIVFPGWWVDEVPIAKSQILVMNPDRLEGILKNLPKRLEQKDIGFIAKRLELFANDIPSPWEVRAQNIESFYDDPKVW